MTKPYSQEIKMQTANSRATLSILLAFIILGVCLGILMIMSRQTDFVRAQSLQDRVFKQDEPNPANKYFFSEETPLGGWLAQADFDISQTHDPDVPAVIAGIRSYVGKGNWLKQLMIQSVVLNNHTAKSVSAVKFG